MTASSLLTSKSAVTGYYPAPALSDNAETFDAAVDYMKTNINVDAAWTLTNEEYRKRDSLAKERTQIDFWKEAEKKNPQISDILKHDDKFGINIDDANYQSLYEKYKQEADNIITKGRQESPDLWKDIKTNAEVEEEARNKARLSKKSYEDITARNPSFWRETASFAGAIYGGLQDPLNLATMFLAPEGVAAKAGARAILSTAAKEGLYNAGVETASQPFVAAWQKEVGHEYGLGDALQNISYAFAGGAGMSAIIRGTIPTIRKGIDVTGSISRYALEKIVASERLPLRIREAANYLSRIAHIDETVPPGFIRSDHLEEDLLLHRSNIIKMSKDFEQARVTTIEVPETKTLQDIEIRMADLERKLDQEILSEAQKIELKKEMESLSNQAIKEVEARSKKFIPAGSGAEKKLERPLAELKQGQLFRVVGKKRGDRRLVPDTDYVVRQIDEEKIVLSEKNTGKESVIFFKEKGARDIKTFIIPKKSASNPIKAEDIGSSSLTIRNSLGEIKERDVQDKLRTKINDLEALEKSNDKLELITEEGKKITIKEFKQAIKENINIIESINVCSKS